MLDHEARAVTVEETGEDNKKQVAGHRNIIDMSQTPEGRYKSDKNPISFTKFPEGNRNDFWYL